MKTYVVVFLLLTSLLLADVPHLISYQGRLTNSSGVPLTGSHNITFTLYNAAVGGTALWTETHSGVVLNSDGLYNVMLGSVTPFPTTVDFSIRYWLAVSVDGGSEICRYELGASPYALNIADTIRKSTTQVFESDLRVTGNDIYFSEPDNAHISWFSADNALEVNKNFAPWNDNSYDLGVSGYNWRNLYLSGKLYVDGSAPTNQFLGTDVSGNLEYKPGGGADNDWTGAGTGYMYATNTSDNVGIGTTTPHNKLEITGTGSGLRFTNLTSASTAGPTGTKVLSVNANGDVILVTDATGSADNDWTGAGTGYMYATNASDNVGIGTTTPYYPITVTSATASRTASFTNMKDSTNSSAVYGECANTPYYGFGGHFVGGRCGVYADAILDGSGYRYGLEGKAAGGNNGNYGVYGYAYGDSGFKYGVCGIAHGDSGVKYGVYGYADGGGTNWAGCFDGNGHFGGNVSIGTISPDYPLTVTSATASRTANFINTEALADNYAVYGECATTDFYGYGGYFKGGYTGVEGNVYPTGSAFYYGVYGSVYGGSGTNYGVYGYAGGSGTNWAGYFNGNGYFSGNVGIGTTNPTQKLEVNGAIKITGGSDLSEQFEIKKPKPTNLNKILPGMLVCIDKNEKGKLVVSSKPYDPTVLGVVSGAGGIKTGMVLSQSGTEEADGKYPVAVAGRVYCLADASSAPIHPGDLLTTSGTPGYAMKVTDYDKARGAIIGKAMSSLEDGKGLVLVIVTLQ